MIEYPVSVQSPGSRLERNEQLAWKIAAVAADPVGVDKDVEEMIVNRIIDNAGVAAASLNRAPVVNARAQALRHPYSPGAAVFGCASSVAVSPEWAAWANGVAVRELDFHDTFLAEEYSHPGDNIAPILAVAQHVGASGHDVVRAIATAYEIQVDLSRGISLHAHKIDHIAHLGPSAAAGLGTLLHLPIEVIYQAVGQALHTTTTTRQSRKGEISSWKAYTPAFAGKMAIEAVDRAMRGEGAPSPIYEGEDGIIAWLLDGPSARYVVPLPAPGEEKRAILETFTKEYSAEYQAQALIDLAKHLRPRIPDLRDVTSVVIHTSHHTHNVIGTGANDPEKMDPHASRETLDHSIMYIFAVALEDGTWHHEHSYAPERAQRPETVALWHKISTVEDAEWTRRYHSTDPKEIAFGGRVVVTLSNGTVIEDELALADAHSYGLRPFSRPQYVEKFRTLADGVIAPAEQDRFLGATERLSALSTGGEIAGLSFTALHLEQGSSGGDLLMLEATASPGQKRQAFRDELASGRLLRFPGAFNPLSALLIEELGFDGIYGSGAVLSADLGLPDIGLTTLSEVGARGQQIARVTNLPMLIDADTGFGEPMNVARTIQHLEDMGLSGCHIEDQVNPKRCGHLDGKSVVSDHEMIQRITAAVRARRDDAFVICARTDARDVEGFDAMLKRAQSYVDAGADMIFPEALADQAEFEAVRKAIDVPILANMTEFGKSKILDVTTLSSLGVNVVIYPVTLLRIAMGSVERALVTLSEEGSQQSLITEMQTRARLYELLDYEEYNAFDSGIFNFVLGTKGD